MSSREQMEAWWRARGSTCRSHPQTEAITGCSLCGHPLCDACFTHTTDGHPTCQGCAIEGATRAQRGISAAISVVALGWTIAFITYQRATVTSATALGIGAGTLPIALIAYLIFRPSKGVVAARDRSEENEEPPLSMAPAHPYRQQVRRAAARLVPFTSGKTVVFAVGLSLLLTAGILPTALRLPRWLEIEGVLACWWLTFTITLSILLYRGTRIRDDYVFVAYGKRPKTVGTWGPSFDGCSGCSFDIEGIVIALIVLVAIVLAAGALWVLVEIAAPLLVFLAYSLLVKALRQVANDRHGCEGRLARSLGWGALWSTVYIGPLACVVYLVQRAMG